MKQMFVYIVKCADDSYYVGVTNDLERRIREHNLGTDHNAYTYRKTPVTLVFYEIFHDANQAIEFEKQIKGWSRKKKEALIDRNFKRLVELSNQKNRKTS